MKRNKIVYTICLVGLTIVAVFLIFILWAMNSKPVSETLVAKINNGMTKEEVKNILGLPNNIYESNDSEIWTYGKSLRWNFYTVTFSKQGTVLTAEMDD